MGTDLLKPEWERIDLLGTCLADSRRGQPIPEAALERLGRVQREVESLRCEPPWRGVVERHGLDSLDQDIMAFALAPDAEPSLGWMFQTLQAGTVSAYPSAALMREMLGLDSSTMAAFHQHLEGRAPLIRNGLIETPGGDVYAPLRPTSRTRAELLGWRGSRSAPQGAVEIEASATLEDLVLPDNCLQALREFLMWVKCSDMVVNTWGGRRCGGPVALFCGPSGTGKTFAAEALANALDWRLYRVDLGLLVSKYVGETEKNLNALFDSAQGEQVMLLFDEADSLFGKRGEVKEARDRYANMEVSHLLSRMERHHGPCVLTSNLRHALDSAFARRFQSVIEFPRPDASARARLWELHLPPRAPMAPEVDCRLLGETVTLTGGQIRNAALHAAYLAAGEGGPIDLSRIARAVWSELGKEGRERLRSNLGALANHLPENPRYA
ncbi:MAG: ATP-binding protein [Nitrospirales bacterium]|nr:ATP-binding protein [Nitrospirales bacterium]